MAAWRLFDRLRSFYGQSGELLAGGYINFSIAGTSTATNVYGDKELTVNNGSTVDLDASGRLEFDVWADTGDAFKAELYDSDDVKHGEIDDLEVPGGAGQTIPVPDSGEFLTGDGTSFAVATIREVPDPTGNADKILSTDGTDLQWIAKPADGTANVTQDANSFGVENMLMQRGTATATASGGVTANKPVTFGTTYSSVWAVYVTVTSGQQPGGPVVTYLTSPPSTTGFTAYFDVAEGDAANSTIVNDIDFEWVAFGVIP